MLALWGSARHPERELPARRCGANWAKDMTGKAIDSGHFLAEENPDATARAPCSNSSGPDGDAKRSTARARFPAPRRWRRRSPFDAARLQDYLAQQHPDFACLLSVKQFKGGQSNPTYLLETAQAPLCAAAKAARQVAALRACRGSRIPRHQRPACARLSGGTSRSIYCADESVAGTAFYVMGFVEGRVFWEPHMPDSSPTERTAVYDAMNATLGAAAFIRSGRHRAVGFRQGRKLCRAPDRALVEAISRLADRADRGDGSPDGLAAAAMCRRRHRCASCTATTGSTT